MTLSPGTKLGHYEIIDMLGKGGMGEVYRATDTRLPREVAIKVSSHQFSDRFAREAKVIASLNHPNICTLFDVGPNYLVMELVEGPTLADRIKEGAVPLNEASGIARQVAEALDYAHEKGVVHRDLKPGNVKIRPDGVVKVLDFGLAKVGRVADPSDESPTVTIGETEAGVILGTAAYMAPEQAKGKVVDKRADVWAFGVVFYEMLSGRRLFAGDSMSDTLANVLREEPKWDRVPVEAHRLLRECLEKDPQKRLRHIGDVMRLMDAPVGQASGLSAATGRRPVLLWAATLVGVAVIGAAVAMWAPWRSGTGGQAVRFEVGPAEKMTFINGGAMAVSPDGHWMVFPANSEDGVTRFWLRSLDSVEVRALPGTETISVTPPASWSWDSRYVIFGAGGKLKKVDIQGGPPQTIGDIPNLNGAGWNKDGVIVAGTVTGGPLLRYSASGGGPAPLTVLRKGETNHKWPQLLPDGRHFLYLSVASDSNTMGIYSGSIDSKPEEQSTRRILATDRQAYYAASPGGGPGRLVFLRDSTLMAQPFDPDKLELSGEPVAVVEGVDSFRIANYGLFSVSDTGTLVYRGGASSGTVLTWLDTQGNPAGVLGQPGDYWNPAISPDGTRVAVAIGPPTKRDIWILDVASGRTNLLTFDPAPDDYPVWSPDGKNVAFSSARSSQIDLYIKPADGSGEDRLLFKSDTPKAATNWSRDGRFLLFTSAFATPNIPSGDVWALPDPLNASSTKPLAVLNTPFAEGMGQFSPDGRWIAYSSGESGAPQIYVRPFSPQGAAGAKYLVSQGDGIRPHWRADGKELYYTTLNIQQMAVDIDTSRGFQRGTPKRMFAAPAGALVSGWDVSPDGKRFLFVAPPNSGRTIPFTVVLNWAAGLKK